MHPPALRLRAAVWVVGALIAAVCVHLGTPSGFSPAAGTTAGDAHGEASAVAVRAPGQIAPAHPVQREQSGHHLDLASAVAPAYVVPVHGVQVLHPADLGPACVAAGSRTCGRAPPGV